MKKRNLYYYINTLKIELESFNDIKDYYLTILIKKYWPKNITPNHVTWTRVVIGMLLFVLLFNFKNNNGFVIFPLFLIGIATDLLDGPIARTLNMKTDVGFFLAPIANRILIIPIFMYTILGYQALLSAIILFEIINAGASLYMIGTQMPLSSNIFDKAKTFLQSCVLIVMLLFWPRLLSPFFVALLWISVAFLVLSVILKIFEVKSYYVRKVKTL